MNFKYWNWRQVSSFINKKGRKNVKAEEFNEKHGAGTHVIYTDDFGKEEKTVTTSEAWDVCGTAVVKLKGKTGGFDLERMRVVDPD